MAKFTFHLRNRIEFPIKHVLICEDTLDQSSRFYSLFSGLFGPQGKVQVSCVPGGMMAASILSNIWVDLLLIDYDMPYGNGEELVQWVQENHIKVPMVGISGIPSNNYRFLELGVSECFLKSDMLDGKVNDRLRKLLQITIGD